MGRRWGGGADGRARAVGGLGGGGPCGVSCLVRSPRAARVCGCGALRSYAGMRVRWRWWVQLQPGSIGRTCPDHHHRCDPGSAPNNAACGLHGGSWVCASLAVAVLHRERTSTGRHTRRVTCSAGRARCRLWDCHQGTDRSATNLVACTVPHSPPCVPTLLTSLSTKHKRKEQKKCAPP